MSLIGFWAGRPRQRLHAVESEIEDRVVMRCGKEMYFHHPRAGDILAGGSQPRCKVCDNQSRI